MIKSYAFRSTFLALLFGVSFGIMSCNKDDTSVTSNSDLLGTWESTTFQVSGCTDVQEDIEMRSCDFSEFDDVDCGVLEFRTDGKVVQDSGGPNETVTSYASEKDMLTLTDPQDNETLTFRFEVSGNTLTLYLEDFNSHGCMLASNLIRKN